MVNDDDLFLCPTPHPAGIADDRHICDSRADLTRPFLDNDDEVCYPMQLLVMRCKGCGVALTSHDNSGGRWGRYVIHEEPW